MRTVGLGAADKPRLPAMGTCRSVSLFAHARPHYRPRAVNVLVHAVNIMHSAYMRVGPPTEAEGFGSIVVSHACNQGTVLQHGAIEGFVWFVCWGKDL